MIVYVLLLSLAVQSVHGAPTKDEELKDALKGMDTEQIHDLAQRVFDAQLKEEDRNAFYMEETTPVPEERAALPEPMVQRETKMLRELRELRNEISNNRERLDRLIGQLERGDSSGKMARRIGSENGFENQILKQERMESDMFTTMANLF